MIVACPSLCRRSRQGKQRYWKRFVSQDTGCRMTKQGDKLKTKTDHYAWAEERVKQWAHTELAAGFELSQQDLLDEYSQVLEETMWELEEKEKTGASLTSHETLTLQRCKHRLAALEKPHNQKHFRAKVAASCEIAGLYVRAN